jgi:predicted DNA-binding ribbon-helix-helix protein
MKEIAVARRITLSDLVSEIDRNRDQGNLSSAIRLNDALTNLDQHIEECGGTGQCIEPAATSEGRPVSRPGGFSFG